MTSKHESTLHGVFRALLQGQYERGKGGVLFTKEDKCAYMFAREFTDIKFQNTLQEIIDEDQDQNFFVVDNKDDALHILAYSKEVVEAETQKEFARMAMEAQRVSSNETVVEEIGEESSASSLTPVESHSANGREDDTANSC